MSCSSHHIDNVCTVSSIFTLKSEQIAACRWCIMNCLFCHGSSTSPVVWAYASPKMLYTDQTVSCVQSTTLVRQRDELERDWWNTVVTGNIQNPRGAHYSSKHSDTPTPDIPFGANIIRRTWDHVDRKLMEAVEIAENKPCLNTDSGRQLLPTIRKRIDQLYANVNKPFNT